MRLRLLWIWSRIQGPIKFGFIVGVIIAVLISMDGQQKTLDRQKETLDGIAAIQAQLVGISKENQELSQKSLEYNRHVCRALFELITGKPPENIDRCEVSDSGISFFENQAQVASD